MHRLGINNYVGQPGETVTLSTDVHGSGSVVVRVDGQDIGATRTFQLKSTAGAQTSLQIALFGATGDTCIVGVATVDGGTDGDLLMCQPHAPAPVHNYTFMVATAAAVASLAAVRGGQ